MKIACSSDCGISRPRRRLVTSQKDHRATARGVGTSRALLRLIAGLEQELWGLEHPPEPDAGQKGCGPSKRSPRAFEAT